LQGLLDGGAYLALVAGSDPLAGAGWLSMSPPEAVIRFGGLPTSKALWTWLAEHPEVPQIVVEPAGWRDPTGSASLVVRGDAGATAAGLAKIATGDHDEWRSAWRAADAKAQSVIDEILVDAPALTEPAVARMLTRHGAGVFGVGSSMPIRDIDAFGVSTERPVRYVANRGASGIDGTISMTLGAIAASGSPGVALVGDVAALHDLTAIATASRLDLPATIVVVHNDGGGIFHLLPQADATPHDLFEKLFGTPHGTDFVSVARAFGVAADRVTTAVGLETVLADEPPHARVIEVPTDRVTNAELHRAIVSQVARVL
ncbi:MAG: thiamine pyrophosphate-dependent enzyme, partial [Acidimicrobiia bacterium]